ncbi:MAG: DUF5615 family PIN-like protein [Saprospiraceae bacterium]
MLKFVLDVGVGHAVHQYLIHAGFDAVSVTLLDPSMPDSDILLIAERDQRMVVTMDKDFGELVFQSGRPHSGVLLLRLEDATGVEKVAVLSHILTNHAHEMAGKFCVFQNGRLRIRG